MILRVNPNRMELLRLRRRLVLAKRGHKLLQDKLEEMMRRFLLLLKDIDKAKETFKNSTNGMIQNFLYCFITTPRPYFKESLENIKSEILLEANTTRIMNVKVPLFNILGVKITRRYDFFKTSAQMDIAISSAKDYIQAVVRLAGLLKTLDILSYEIKRTRRRVNALEYVLIPSMEDTIKYITQKLSEFERGNLTRLMRVKEIVRSH